MKKASTAIQQDKLQISSDLLRALAHPLRLKILKFIDQNDTIHVNKIYNTLKLEQSITSQHLRILRSAGLVDTEKEGKFRHYQINYNRIQMVLKAINNFTGS